MRLLLYLEVKHQKGSLHTSSCRFSAVYNRLVSHSEALDKPRYVVDQLIAKREYLVSKETFKLEEPSGFHISTTEDVSVRVLMVYKNSVIFNAFGAVAADKSWSMEGDIVELLESAFPEDHMRGARFA